MREAGLKPANGGERGAGLRQQEKISSVLLVGIERSLWYGCLFNA
jgi:hypothetical protein